MIGLLLETSTEKGLIALVQKKTFLATRTLVGGPALSHQLATEVESLLQETTISPQFVAAGNGPGSYTGVRVGTALAKALSFGWKIPLYSYCNLLSFLVPDIPDSAVLVDARGGGFYYLSNRFADPCLLPLAECEKTLSPLSQIGSPHPELILKRLPFLKRNLVETSPNPFFLCSDFSFKTK
ncbi:MAG: tRNA (adenosine(37)-N6)-threonylcarbamoyltransferase complex dimerization subunit type 1 TsaB [Chlamydiia bacterium]|nr:tRNA (adenosine(37)-N6)-threonylcarbamoyltransferase complex dimerization subunit type 1 TsaB [Chlamydiia bacterium]